MEIRLNLVQLMKTAKLTTSLVFSYNSRYHYYYKTAY